MIYLSGKITTLLSRDRIKAFEINLGARAFIAHLLAECLLNA